MLIGETNELSTIIVATNGDIVLSNNKISVSEIIQPCFQEKADTRILLHVNHVPRSGLKRITISTVDTDIVVISLYIFFDLNVDELWIEYGVSTRKKWIPVHSYAIEFGEENCRALSFWYCFTGCDTVSQFFFYLFLFMDFSS